MSVFDVCRATSAVAYNGHTATKKDGRLHVSSVAELIYSVTDVDNRCCLTDVNNALAASIKCLVKCK